VEKDIVISDQRSVISGGAVAGAELVRFVDHGVEHTANFIQIGVQFCYQWKGQISAIAGSVNPVLSLELFAIRIGEFAYEMLFVSSLRPSLGDLATDGPR
jgi:hypothetical protein